MAFTSRRWLTVDGDVGYFDKWGDPVSQQPAAIADVPTGLNAAAADNAAAINEILAVLRAYGLIAE